jgi:PAS domain S-box-containing protein
MKAIPSRAAEAESLRRRAAKKVKAKARKRPYGAEARLEQQLDIHRVELELQNEELRTARIELEQGLERYTQLFDFAPIGYCTLDVDGGVLQINHTAAALMDEARSQIKGKKFVSFLSLRDRARFRMLMNRTITKDEPRIGEVELFRIEGNRPIVRLRLAHLQGPPPVILIAFEDITAQKHAEEQLRRAHQELRDADRRKDEFLAVLSHELRTPLSALLIHGQLLQQSGIDPARAQKSGEAVERAARAQARLIDDLLDVSRIIAGKMRMNFARTDITPIVRAAVDAVAGDAANKGIVLTAEIDPAISAVWADWGRLQQAIGNLLNNAVKFTPSGGNVRIRVDGVGQQTRIRVEDSGSGIEPAFLPHLFERFVQADRTSTRSSGGLGLGLSIVQHVIEAHRGTVKAASPGRGKGSTFTIMLPSPAAKQKVRAARKEPERSSISGARLLVVEDDPSTRATLTEVLEMAGAEVKAADGAETAMTELQMFRPDVLVCDIAMPGEDGCDLLRRIRRRRADQGGKVPALALTAFAGEEDRRRTEAAGFQMHVVKPVDVNRLVGAVAELLKVGNGSRAQVPRI